MKKFIFKSVIFLLLLFIFTSVLEDIIDLGLRKSKADNFNEWNEILDSKINADLLISGSSRAWLHYSPQVIDSALRLNSYNLGLDGYSFQMQYYRLKLYLENNKKPSFLIQNIDHLTMNKQADLFNYQQFIPYLNNNTIIQGIALYNGFSRLGGGQIHSSL